MVLVVPIAQENGEKSLLTTIKEAKSFAFLKLGNGMQIENMKFKPSFSNEMFDYIVTPDKNDDFEDAFDLGARVLLGNRGMSVEDIVEGVMFRELDEII